MIPTWRKKVARFVSGHCSELPAAGTAFESLVCETGASPSRRPYSLGDAATGVSAIRPYRGKRRRRSVGMACARSPSTPRTAPVRRVGTAVIPRPLPRRAKRTPLRLIDLAVDAGRLAFLIDLAALGFAQPVAAVDAIAVVPLLLHTLAGSRRAMGSRPAPGGRRGPFARARMEVAALGRRNQCCTDHGALPWPDGTSRPQP